MRMSRDNVTPFRRPPRRPQQRSSGGKPWTTPRGKAVLVQLVTLLAYALNFYFRAPPSSYIALAVGVAGAAIAFSNRSAEAMPWAQTHHEHALRTLIIGYAIWTVASLLPLVLATLDPVKWYIWLAVLVWVVIRAGVGLVLAIMRRPIWHPKGMLL
ncbi:hypothetical protein [Terricaulis sp.]|uniref:hypothetical protein n=1 Tax=Terricaulis sp. TaxID=2768686 RepID=UPI0037847771